MPRLGWIQVEKHCADEVAYAQIFCATEGAGHARARAQQYTVELKMRRSPRSPRGRPPLILSSNPDVVDLYVLSMRSVRTPMLSVSSVEAALQLVQDRAVSAVIVDVANPAVDWEVCRLLQSQAGPRVPLIVLTGWLDTDARARATELGCAAFVSKPVSPERLMDIVRRVRAGERDIFLMD